MEKVEKSPDNNPMEQTKVLPIKEGNLWFYSATGLVGIVVWWLIYINLPQLSSFLTYSLLRIEENTHLGSALEFFFYDVPKVMMLLILVIFGVGIIRTFFTPERTRDLLSGKSEFFGNILAALLELSHHFAPVPLFPCLSVLSRREFRWALLFPF